ncbi:MAG: abortive infection protein [Bacteroidota bacterium]|nr:abortive infection protein [Bacteroidota bacterium]
MKGILEYIRRYFAGTDKKVLLSISFFTALFVFINYHFGLDGFIRKNNSLAIKLISWYIVFLAAFAIPYLITGLVTPGGYNSKTPFLFLLLFAPLIFAIKISLPVSFHFSDMLSWNNYWNNIVYWPVLLLIVTGILFVIWKLFDRSQPFYGLTTNNIVWKPYLLMLLIMLPLIAIASTQADFLALYPKIKSVAEVYYEQDITWWHKLLFELSYGSDFIGIELFFRGFLILTFIKWAGKDAILPMACFYCTIHFGKPLGECISSYFGGILLGIVVYNTRSILGGLMLHLGIAWLMELGGYIGNTLIK